MEHTAAGLRSEARRLREYAQGITDPIVVEAIHELIEELEGRALLLDDRWDRDE